MAADGEDHLPVDVDPGDLVIRELRHHTLESGLPPESHRHVADVLGDAGAASTD